VDGLQGVFQVSIRRACKVLRFQKSSYFYRSRRLSQAALTKRIREIAETRVRYGYRRIHVLLQREAWAVNHKRVYRLYVEEDLQIRNKRPKRKVAAKVHSDRKPPSAPNEVWAMDFLSDQLFDGRKIRILTIVDAFSKLSPAIDVGFRYTGADVVTTLERIAGVYGVPRTIRLDNVLCGEAAAALGQQISAICKSRDLTCRTVSDQIAVDAVEPSSEPAILAWSPSAWARRAVKPRSRLPVRRRRRA
jgi:putative transposase